MATPSFHRPLKGEAGPFGRHHHEDVAVGAVATGIRINRNLMFREG